MRLLILNQYGLPKGATGITRHGDLGAALAARGHSVTVVASSFNYLTRRSSAAPQRGSGDQEYHGVRFKWLRTGEYVANDRRRVRSMVSYMLRAAWSASRLADRPDIVVASSPHLLTGVAGVLVAARYRVPFVLEVRDLWPSVLVDLGAVRRGGITHRILERLELWLYRRARLVIFVPPYGSNRLRELGLRTDRAVHVPNGVDPEALRRDPLPPSLKALLESLAGRRIVMYLGAHGVANDLPTVARALSHLRADAPQLYDRSAFVFIGDGAEKTRFQQELNAEQHSSVFLHPSIPKGAIGEALEHADVCLVSVAPAVAHAYGLSPNKLFDYMAAGKPTLLASHVPTAAEDAGSGERYEPGDAAAMGRALRRLLDMSETDREAMGARGLAAIHREYRIEAVAERLLNVLQAVSREGHPA